MSTDISYINLVLSLSADDINVDKEITGYFVICKRLRMMSINFPYMKRAYGQERRQDCYFRHPCTVNKRSNLPDAFNTELLRTSAKPRGGESKIPNERKLKKKQN
jgi:hypothetical protein